MKEEVLVSVIMITYQHVDFIRRNIQSVVDQKTDFKYEFLLGEDMSTDGTREICLEMAQEYPDKINLVLQDRKDVIYIQGRPSGRRNFIDLFQRAKGKYIALCPGDDTWTDDSKLQNLADILEKDPGVAVCFHNALNVYSDGHTVDYVRTWLDRDTIPKTFYLKDIVNANFIPSSGCMFRRSNFPVVPEDFYTVPALDWYIHVSGAMRGKIQYLDKMMSNRRVHSGGLISSRPRLAKIDWNLDMIEYIDSLTKHEFTEILGIKRVELLRSGLDIALHQDPKVAKEYLKKLGSIYGSGLTLRAKIKACIIIYLPWLSELILKIRTVRTKR